MVSLSAHQGMRDPFQVLLSGIGRRKPANMAWYRLPRDTRLRQPTVPVLLRRNTRQNIQFDYPLLFALAHQLRRYAAYHNPYPRSTRGTHLGTVLPHRNSTDGRRGYGLHRRSACMHARVLVCIKSVHEGEAARDSGGSCWVSSFNAFIPFSLPPYSIWRFWDMVYEWGGDGFISGSAPVAPVRPSFVLP